MTKIKPTEEMTDADYLELCIGDGTTPMQRALRYLRDRKGQSFK